MKPMLFQPCLRDANVATHRWPGYPQPRLEHLGSERVRGSLEEREEYERLAVDRVQDRRSRAGVQLRADRAADALVSLHPDPDPATLAQPEIPIGKVSLDGRERVPNHPIRQT